MNKLYYIGKATRNYLGLDIGTLVGDLVSPNVSEATRYNELSYIDSNVLSDAYNADIREDDKRNLVWKYFKEGYLPRMATTVFNKEQDYVPPDIKIFDGGHITLSEIWGNKSFDVNIYELADGMVYVLTPFAYSAKETVVIFDKKYLSKEEKEKIVPVPGGPWDSSPYEDEY